MRRVVNALLYAVLLLATSYGTYTWGWYRGLSYHSLVSGLSEAKISLSAAQSLRQSDPQLALELLESNISWMSAELHETSNDVPADEQGNYDLVMRRLRAYRDRYERLNGR